MKTTTHQHLDTERAKLDAERARVDEQLAGVRTELAAAEQRRAKLDAERKRHRRRALADRDAAARTELDRVHADSAAAALLIDDLNGTADDLAAAVRDLDEQLRANAYQHDLHALREDLYRRWQDSATVFDAAVDALAAAFSSHRSLGLELQAEGQRLGFERWSRVGEDLRLKLNLVARFQGADIELADTGLDRHFKGSLAAIEAKGFPIPDTTAPPANYRPSPPPAKKEAA